jgi:two-component system response regulator FixJ
MVRSVNGHVGTLAFRESRVRSGNVQVFHPISLNFADGSKTSSMDLDTMAIYVVDDHAAMRSSLDALLSSFGFSPYLFSSGEEFLAAADNLDPGILLTDLRMSGIDGLDLVARLKNRKREFPAIIMTAHGDVDAAIRALRLGARDFIQKPFRETELLAILQRETEALRNSDTSDAIRLTAQVKLAGLSPREFEVVQGLAQGKTNKSIAHELALSIRTVEMHRSRAMDRLGCRNIAELIAIALHGDIMGMAPGCLTPDPS